jgi:periplasmic protein TonB
MFTNPAQLSRFRFSVSSVRGFVVRLTVVVGIHALLLFGLIHVDPELREKVEPVMVSIIESRPLPAEPVPARPPSPPPTVVRDTPRAAPEPIARKAPPVPTPVPSQAPEATTSPTTSPVAVETASAEVAPAPALAGAPPSDAATSTVSSTAPVLAVSKPIPPAVVPPSFDAAYLNNPRPEYPRVSRRMGEHGKVMLRVYVTAQGTAERVEVRTSSGSQRLDHAARSAVEQWKFVPARQGDDPVAAWVIVPITFVLEG